MGLVGRVVMARRGCLAPHKLVKSDVAGAVGVDRLEDLVKHPRRAAVAELARHRHVELDVVDVELGAAVGVEEVDDLDDLREAQTPVRCGEVSTRPTGRGRPHK